MKILLQFPEGLKQEALKLAKEYERKGNEVFLSASPCYGACDLALDEARWTGAKKIVHFGHSRFVTKKLPVKVEYVEYRLNLNSDLLLRALPSLKGFRNVALGTTVQYAHEVKAMKKFLEENGKKVFVGKGAKTPYEGQVLGCDALAVMRFEKAADAILFVGEGDFHPLAIDSDKPIFVLHPKTGQVRQINDDIARLRKKRRGALLSAIDAKAFGILLSTKPGQFNVKLAEWAKKELEKRGKSAALLVANEFDPVVLADFMSFDCYVTTACPRISEDSERFGKPVLDIAMLKETLSILDELEHKSERK